MADAAPRHFLCLCSGLQQVAQVPTYGTRMPSLPASAAGWPGELSAICSPCAPAWLCLQAVQLAAEAANLQITWGAWALAGIVPGLICLVATPLILYFIYPPEVSCLRWHWLSLCDTWVMLPRLSSQLTACALGSHKTFCSHSCQHSLKGSWAWTASRSP